MKVVEVSSKFTRTHSFQLIALAWLFVANPTFVLPARTLPHNQRPSFPWAQRFYHEKGKYFQGDIMINPGNDDFLKAGSSSPRWFRGVIPFATHPNIRMPGRQSIYAAMQDIQSKTCIKFRQRRQEKDYVAISSFNQGCFSYVGRSGGKQQLNLGPGCWHKTTIIHELVHAIGFWHEQSREDRDEWITVQWKNIPQHFWREFQKQPKLNDFGTDYDLRSVMHYSFNAFSRNKRPSITTKQSFPLRYLGTGDDSGGLTETDALQINRMYNCTTDPMKYKGKGK